MTACIALPGKLVIKKIRVIINVFCSARALNHGKCRPKFTIVMVAFDLEESASQGSLVFVQDFLLPQLLRTTGAEVRGAIILDSILHYNDTINSQNYGQEWGRLIPDAVKTIEKNKSKSF